MIATKSLRLPMRVSQQILLARRKENEPLVVLMITGVGTTAAYEFRDSDGREYVCRWENKLGGHIMRVPVSLWCEGNHRMAKAVMEKRRAQYPMVVGFECAVPTADAEGTAGLVVDPAVPVPVVEDDGLGFEEPVPFVPAEIGGVPLRVLIEQAVADGSLRTKTLVAQLGGDVSVEQVLAEIEHGEPTVQFKSGWIRLAE